MSASKLPNFKSCPACGWRMTLLEERLAEPESEHRRPAPITVQFFYTCGNPACEFEERAA